MATPLHALTLIPIKDTMADTPFTRVEFTKNDAIVILDGLDQAIYKGYIGECALIRQDVVDDEGVTHQAQGCRVSLVDLHNTQFATILITWTLSNNVIVDFSDYGRYVMDAHWIVRNFDVLMNLFKGLPPSVLEARLNNARLSDFAPYESYRFMAKGVREVKSVLSTMWSADGYLPSTERITLDVAERRDVELVFTAGRDEFRVVVEQRTARKVRIGLIMSNTTDIVGYIYAPPNDESSYIAVLTLGEKRRLYTVPTALVDAIVGVSTYHYEEFEGIALNAAT